MIRIIDEKPHHSVVKQVACKHCGVTLEYTPNDIEQDYTTDYTGGRDHFNCIYCPKCTSRIRL